MRRHLRPRIPGITSGQSRRKRRRLLHSHFAAQLDGYRSAYGGEGAQFRYGDFTTLTIVNGQLAPDVPVSDETEWATPTVISLNTRDTTCVSWKANNSNGFVFINVKTGLPLDPIRADGPVREPAEIVDTRQSPADPRRVSNAQSRAGRRHNTTC